MASVKLVERTDEDAPWSLLLGAMDGLAAARTIDDVSKVVTSQVRTLVGADGVTFVLREGERCHYIEEDAIGPLWRGLQFPMTACISGWCMLQGSSAEVPDIRLDPRIPQDAYQPTFVKSLVMVPVGKPATAAIGVYWSELGKCDAHTRRLVETLARCAGLAISTIRLQEALAQNQERTMVILEQANMGTWSLDMDALTLSTSLACRTLLGWQSHQGFAYPDLLATLDEPGREQLKSCISELAARGGHFEMEALTLAADPTPRRIVVSGYAEPSLDTPAQRIAGFCREAA